jgi:Fe-S oxidoreductase
MRRHGLPVPVSRDVIYWWSRGLQLPESGETLLFTGGLYQLAPYIEALVRLASSMEKGGVVSGLASRLSSTGIARGLARLLARADRGRVERFESIVRSIAIALRRAGIVYAYSPRADAYSGVILYDLGLDDAFAAHAARVHGSLREAGARRLITIDPHTTFVMREVYPRYVDGFDLEVISYIELLGDGAGAGGGRGEAVIHDPCLYARNLGIVEGPRRLLEAAGYAVREPRRSRRMTYCCGGPIESLFPSLSKRVAATRMSELAALGRTIVVMCPICLVNLSSVAPSGVSVRDLGEVIGGPGEPRGGD